MRETEAPIGNSRMSASIPEEERLMSLYALVAPTCLRSRRAGRVVMRTRSIAAACFCVLLGWGARPALAQDHPDRKSERSAA
jgi:hypothetical protein